MIRNRSHERSRGLVRDGPAHAGLMLARVRRGSTCSPAKAKRIGGLGSGVLLAPCPSRQPLPAGGRRAYPLLSTSAALAMAARAAALLQERPGWLAGAGIPMAIASGTVMASGMFFTLAFLPIGPTVALVV